MPPVCDFKARHRSNPRSPALLDRSWEAVLKFLGNPMLPVRPMCRLLWRRDLPSGATTIVAFSLRTRSPSPRSWAVRAGSHLSSICLMVIQHSTCISRPAT
ncbi:hypothetical protein VPH35_020632 [Triticum aestivum]